MQTAPGEFVGQTLDNAFSAPDAYRLDAAGIKAGEYSPVLAWLAITSIEAWMITCEDYDGWGVFRHLRLHTEPGYQWHLSDRDPGFFTDLENALAHYLHVEVDWLKGPVEDEYQRRRHCWHRGWLGGRHKPVVYQRAA